MSYGDMFGEPKSMLAEMPTQSPTKVLDRYSTDGIYPTRQLFAQTPAGPLAIPNKFNEVIVPLVQEARQSMTSGMKISEFGTAPGKEVARLADEVLKKTTTANTGDFGKGITSILALTQTVQPTDLNAKQSLIQKATNFLARKKVEVTSHFEDVAKQIDGIAISLTQKQKDMIADNEFLQRLYDSNLKEYHALGYAIDALVYVIDEQKQVYSEQNALAQASQDMAEIQKVTELEDNIKLMEKQVDRLKRMQHVAMLTAPEIKSTQKGNINTCQKFDDLMNVTLPAWKKTLSQVIIASRLKANTELGQSIDDKTNEFFLKASEMNSNNRIAVAKSSERSVVDVTTLETMQKNLIDSLKEVRQIEEQGQQEREQASIRIGQLREDMKQEMLNWRK